MQGRFFLTFIEFSGAAGRMSFRGDGEVEVMRRRVAVGVICYFYENSRVNNLFFKNKYVILRCEQGESREACRLVCVQALI